MSSQEKLDSLMIRLLFSSI